MAASLTVTRVAHSCVLLDFEGARILTDPWFSERATYRRGEPLGITVDRLPTLAGVLVSHRHYDHFDLGAFAAYRDRDVPLVVMRGLARRAHAHGFANVTEVDAWQQAQLGPLTVTATPAKHGVPEVTYVVQGADHTIFFGADTLRIRELDELPARFGAFDLALMPINGLRIRPLLNRKVVMDEGEAAELTALLRPRVAVPIHYAFTGGSLGDRLLIKHRGDPELYSDHVARLSHEVKTVILAPGQPLEV